MKPDLIEVQGLGLNSLTYLSVFNWPPITFSEISFNLAIPRTILLKFTLRLADFSKSSGSRSWRTSAHLLEVQLLDRTSSSQFTVQEPQSGSATMKEP